MVGIYIGPIVFEGPRPPKLEISNEIGFRSNLNQTGSQSRFHLPGADAPCWPQLGVQGFTQRQKEYSIPGLTGPLAQHSVCSVRFVPPMASEDAPTLEKLWLGGRTGILAAWSEAKAWALRVVDAPRHGTCSRRSLRSDA